MDNKRCGNSSKLPLAQEGTDALSPQIRDRGFDAIDDVASTVLGAFPQDAHHLPLDDTKEMKSLLILLQLDQKLEILGLELSGIDEIGTPLTLIQEIARVAKLNPILVVAAAKFREQSNWKESFPAPGENRDAELRKAVTYCYLLHCIAKTYANEPPKTELPGGQTTFAEKLLDHFDELYDSFKWEGLMTEFEHSKKIALFTFWKQFFVRHKKGKGFGPEKFLRAPLLSINILEAMVQDLKKGYIDNACCGFELILEPGNKTLKGTGGTNDYIWTRPDGRQSGVLCIQSPLPIIWNNLYTSWNLAFCSDQYSDWPFFFAKLLNPAVLGSYHEVDAGIFLALRVSTLLVHISYVGLQRQAAKRITDDGMYLYSKQRHTGIYGPG